MAHSIVIPERAPHFVELWEAGVKYHLSDKDVGVQVLAPGHVLFGNQLSLFDFFEACSDTFAKHWQSIFGTDGWLI